MEPGTRRVLVTGAGSGIGAAIARALLAQGGQVALVGRRSEPLDELARTAPGRAVPLVCDLGDPASRAGLVARARDALGGLDGLVHAAGVIVHEEPGKISESALREQLELNLVAPLRLGEEALALLDEGGAILFISSTLAIKPIRTAAVYAAAKAGLVSLTHTFAAAGAARRVRVNALLPGVVDTQMIRAPRPGQADVAAILDELTRLHPLGRLGTPEDLAGAALHLLAAPWTTGTALVVDGGLLL